MFRSWDNTFGERGWSVGTVLQVGNRSKLWWDGEGEVAIHSHNTLCIPQILTCKKLH